MENLSCVVIALLLSLWLIKYFFCQKLNLPPSPLAIPLIGHLHLIKGSFHQALSSLASQYGPILYLRLGFQSTVVVTSPSAVEECFTKNDIVFANRPPTLAGDRLTYNHTAYVWTPYGDLWRTLRRLTVVELFSSNSLLKGSAFREQEIHVVLHQLFRVFSNGENLKVELKYWFDILVFNIMMTVVSGKSLVKGEDAGIETGKQILEDVKAAFFPSLPLLNNNMCDLFPILRWFGYKGIEKGLISVFRKRDDFLQDLVDEVRQTKFNSADINFGRERKMKAPLIETLLYLQESEPDFYSDDLIKSLVLVMLIGGTESSANTMNSAMSLLLVHPEALLKARAEIVMNVGHERLVSDLDFANLPYLRCVINETLRLNPPVPLLLPHYASEDCTVGGFDVPRETSLLVNAWAIHRDPNVWDEPDTFKPERFVGVVVEGGNEKFKFLPFGAGRRICPGANMAMRTMVLALASLIQCFEWEKVGQDTVCSPRQASIHLLSQL